MSWRKKKERRIVWLQKLNVKECDLNNNTRVCCRHFASGRPCKNSFDNSHPDWAPSLHVRNSVFDRVVQRNISRHSRRLERESRTLEQINAVVNNGKSAANRQDNDVPNAVVNNEHDCLICWKVEAMILHLNKFLIFSV
ncbi:hypothetical protein OUZ56_016720 [Daphnia magna]|uniref:THAP-type domain-containing protein n=1 Tax=Daphnia magna TaxID=35525 RepID=A0ABR0ART2_9CRUS|nr:hypothetical protein OUZ56_016720 [Daphnia magna]